MAFLDKFNSWYDRAVPDSEIVNRIAWQEPVAGARHRWRANLGLQLLIPGLIFGILLLPFPGKHGSAPQPLNVRLIMASSMAAFIVAIGLISSFTKTGIFLTAKQVVIGAGRRPTRLEFDSETTIRLEQRDGFTTLVFIKDSKERERVYLDSSSERGVIELLTSAGILSTTDQSTPPP